MGGWRDKGHKFCLLLSLLFLPHVLLGNRSILLATEYISERATSHLKCSTAKGLNQSPGSPCIWEVATLQWAHAQMRMAQLVAQLGASHAEPHGVEAGLTVLIAKLEGDDTDDESLSATQRRDAMRAVIKSIVVNGKEGRYGQRIIMATCWLFARIWWSSSMKALGLKSLARTRSKTWHKSCKSAAVQAPAIPYVMPRTDMAAPLAKTVQGPLHSIMLHAKKMDPLLGSERAKNGSTGLLLLSKRTPTALEEEEASVAEKPTGPVFDIAEHATTLNTNTVRLWTVSQMMEECRNHSEEKATSTEQRIP